MEVIDRITSIHKAVEQNRGAEIPDWAYRDVLFMLIDYSIRSFEVLERKLTAEEKIDTFEVFNRLGQRMNIKGLPGSYQEWLKMRREHLQQDLICSNLTKDLYKQYRKHLGLPRFLILKQAQLLVVPERVNSLLSLGTIRLLTPVLSVYKLTRLLKLDQFLRNIILPNVYKAQIKDLDVIT